MTPETQQVVTTVSRETSWEELKVLLSEREKAFNDLKASYETEVATLKAEITTLQTLSPISTAQYDALVAERDLLKSDLDSKTQEAQGYWEELLLEQTKLKENGPLGGMVGASGTYDLDTGKIGAEVTGGISWKKLAVIGGVEWQPDAFTLSIPKIADLKIKAGLQYSF